MARNIIVKRTVKDSVFTHLFQDKEYVLKLCQALHPEEKDVTQGRAEGLTEGLTKGRAEGLTEGRKISTIETVKKMLAESLPVEMIARVSGLSVSEIDEIKNHG